MKILYYLALLLTAFAVLIAALDEHWAQVVISIATLVVLHMWCRPNS
jgi:hypothetical protein